MTKPIKIKNLTIGVGIPKICVPLTGITKEQICEGRLSCKKSRSRSGGMESRFLRRSVK